MRRLILFFAVAGSLLVLEMAFNWWVDPFGEFWKGRALYEASAARPQCLVSEEIVGNAYLPFKLAVFRSRPTKRFVVGSSRVLKIGSWPHERTFANLGVPAINVGDVLYLFKHIPQNAPPQTVYLGLDTFAFNPRYQPFDFQFSTYDKARYLISRATFRSGFDLLHRAPYVFTHRWRKEDVGSRCVIGRSQPNLAWNLDGSRLWAFELQPRLYRPPPNPFTTDLHRLQNGYYADWKSFADDRVRTLGKALAVARDRGWNVIGFSTPDPPSVNRYLSKTPSVAPYWREFGRTMPALFHRYGFTWLDLRNARSIPCSDADFVDGTFHTNAACSMRIRRRLDEAASQSGS
jgi:hypothetical protein